MVLGVCPEGISRPACVGLHRAVLQVSGRTITPGMFYRLYANGYSGHMKTASVTSLKNHLCARLKQVVAGESYLITDRNRAVAVLSPIREGMLDARLAKLAAEGIVRPRQGDLKLQDFLALPKGTCSASLSEGIYEEREAR